MAFNKVIIQGNVSSEVELKQTQSGTSVCSFNVAVNRFSKEPDAKKVDFFTVVAWQAKAEFVSRYFKKGSPILVCGRLENREWSDKQGNKRISTEIIAEEITFVGNKESSAEAKMRLLHSLTRLQGTHRIVRILRKFPTMAICRSEV
jgi:single-strand DNA-binding protein